MRREDKLSYEKGNSNNPTIPLNNREENSQAGQAEYKDHQNQGPKVS